MICITAGVLVLAAVAHFARPDDSVFTQILLLASGFLFGKFTNGFRTPPSPPASVPEPEETGRKDDE